MYEVELHERVRPVQDEGVPEKSQEPDHEALHPWSETIERTCETTELILHS